jgi:hypothetical protein
MVHVAHFSDKLVELSNHVQTMQEPRFEQYVWHSAAELIVGQSAEIISATSLAAFFPVSLGPQEASGKASSHSSTKHHGDTSVAFQKLQESP